MDILIALTACSVPGLIFAVLFYRADRYEREPIHFLVLVFLWGTVPSLILSELLNPQIISLLAWISRSTVTTLVAPVLEESLKALAIASIFFFARQEFDGVLDGLVYGGMVGLGFATAENYIYYIDALQNRGWYALFELFILRGIVFGLSHAMYSGIVGAGFGMARHTLDTRKRISYIIGGLITAYCIHVIHNLGSQSPGLGSILSILIASMGLVIWYISFQLAYKQEKHILETELLNEIDNTLSDYEYKQIIKSVGRPKILDDPSHPRRSKRLRLNIELANRKHRARTIGVHIEEELSEDMLAIRSRITNLQENISGTYNQ
jgi:RsiW-degrading membrane proteinase PrsW (M82 family)